MKILVVDDDPVVGKRIARYLDEHGHRTRLVGSQAEASAVLERERIDCVIIDWMLPDGQGTEFIHRHRAQPSEHYIYYIVVTSLDGPEHRTQAMDAGADDFLLKPVNSGELMMRIRVALRISELHRQLADRNHELAQTKHRLEEDLLSAAKVQRDLLPSKDFAFPGLASDWFLDTSEALGGDLVVLLPITATQLGFAVIDVVGHGAKAAILGVQISRRFRSSSGLSRGPSIDTDILLSPHTLARLFNDEFPMDYRNLQFFTMCYGVIDGSTGDCRYVGCGHPPPLLRRADGTIEVLPVEGHPIGIMDNSTTTFVEQRCQLQPGDSLIVYSDGIPETANREGAMFGTEGMIAALTAAGNDDDPGRPGAVTTQQLLDRLAAAANVWRGHTLAADDCTALALQRRAPGTPEK